LRKPWWYPPWQERKAAEPTTVKTKRDDVNWMKHTLARKTPDGIKLGYKPVVVTNYQPMERKY
jgi:succinate dehydrogenase / fumarate reductase flavoprotein subunit